MTALQAIGKKGTNAVKNLRLEKLRNGFPFMINSNDLESDQCYLEFPDGQIQLVCLDRVARDFKTIRSLSETEAQTIRAKYGFVRS